MSQTISPAFSAFASLYTAEIGALRASIDHLRAWEPSAKRDALIAIREERIEELEAAQEFVAGNATTIVEAAAEAQDMGDWAAEQVAIAAAHLTVAHPSVRWTIVGTGLVGCIAALQIVIGRTSRGWAGGIRTTVWSPDEGEVGVVLSRAEGMSAVIVGNLLASAACAPSTQAA